MAHDASLLLEAARLTGRSIRELMGVRVGDFDPVGPHLVLRQSDTGVTEIVRLGPAATAFFNELIQEHTDGGAPASAGMFGLEIPEVLPIWCYMPDTLLEALEYALPKSQARTLITTWWDCPGLVDTSKSP